MSTGLRWQRLQDLFHAACELPHESREGFAQAQARDDPQLLDELLAMLRIEASATEIVREPVKSPHRMLEAAQILPKGTRFGPWAIDKQIGRGGMGQVYRAYRADGVYEREVALKLVSVAQLDDRQRAFFEVERQLLAQMHHPAIAQIHDAGTDASGRQWLAMEYIEGESITDFCEHNALSLRERIELFLRVCDGVLHAHQKGVVHRDIKPSNILVNRIDGIPMPHLLDFGIASGSGTASVPAGTPGYMSPEQMDPTHRSDSRSDVYSLGALLYEIISGKRPPSSRDQSDTPGTPSNLLSTLAPEQVRTLAERRGLEPRRLIHLLREDLDWIVLKAMQVDPEQRYASVSQLGDDLNRFLNGYPVLAAPLRRRVAARKFIARNRLGVGALILVLLALIAGFTATALALQTAEREAHRTRVTADFLGSVLSSVEPDIARDMDKTLLLHVMENAAERVQAELAGDPRGRNEVELIIADSYSALGLPKKAIPHFESVRVRVRNTTGVGSHPDLLIAQRLGTALVDAGNFEESERVLREAIELGSQHPEGLPVSLIPDLRSRLSWTLRQLGEIDEALAEATRAYDELVSLMPDNHPQLLDAGGRRAILLSDLGQYDEAIALISEMIARRAEELGIDHPRTLNWRLSRAVFHLQKRDYATGEAELKSILEPIARQYGEDSQRLARVHNNLGGALRQQGKIDEAGPHYRFALEHFQRHQGPDAPETLIARHNHANWLLDAGQLEQALVEQQACLSLSEKQFGADHSVTSEVLRGLGLAQIALGHLADARGSLERSMAIKTALFGDADGPLARLREAFAQLEAAERAASTPSD